MLKSWLWGRGVRILDLPLYREDITLSFHLTPCWEPQVHEKSKACKKGSAGSGRGGEMSVRAALLAVQESTESSVHLGWKRPLRRPSSSHQPCTITSAAKPHPEMTQLCVFWIPPTMVTRPKAWAACSSVRQPLWRRNFPCCPI